MWMDEGLDTGDILLPGPPVPIQPDESAGALHDRLAGTAPGLLRKALDLLENGRAPRTPQDPAQATYAPKLDRASGRIDWTRSSHALERHLRAMDPWPGAWTTLPTAAGAPRQLKVFRGAAPGDDQPGGAPGTVIGADARGLLVACGEGALLLTEVQLEGKRRLPAGDFLRGHPVAPGTVLG